MDAPPGAGFGVNVFLRDGDKVYRTWHTNGRGTEQLSHSFGLIDLLPWGRQEEWQDSPDGWPQSPTYSRWSGLTGYREGLRAAIRQPVGVYLTPQSSSSGLHGALAGGAGSGTGLGAGPTGSGTCWGAGSTGAGTCCG